MARATGCTVTFPTFVLLPSSFLFHHIFCIPFILYSIILPFWLHEFCIIFLCKAFCESKGTVNIHIYGFLYIPSAGSRAPNHTHAHTYIYNIMIVHIVFQHFAHRIVCVLAFFTLDIVINLFIWTLKFLQDSQILQGLHVGFHVHKLLKIANVWAGCGWS